MTFGNLIILILLIVGTYISYYYEHKRFVFVNMFKRDGDAWTVCNALLGIITFWLLAVWVVIPIVECFSSIWDYKLF